MATTDVKYTLTLNDLLTSKLHHATVAGEELEGVMAGVEKIAGALGLAFVAFEGIHYFGEAIEKAHELHLAEVQLKNTMENMGTYSEEAFEHATASAGKFASGVLYSKQQVITLQSQLGLIGTIGEDSMGRMVAASANMATKFGGDIGEWGNVLARAINDPMMARRLEQKVFISPAVKEQILELTKAGKESAAQMLLLSQVEERLGTAAKDAFDASPLAAYNKKIEEGTLTLGELGLQLQSYIAPALLMVGEAFVEGLEFIKDHTEAVKDLAFIVGSATAAYVLYSWWQASTIIETGLVTASIFLETLMIEGSLIPALVAVGITGASAWALMTGGLSLILVALYEAYQHSETFRNSIQLLADDAMIAGNALLYVGQIATAQLDAAENTAKRMNELLQDRYNIVHGITQLGVEGKDYVKPFDILGNKKQFAKAPEAARSISPSKASGTKAVTINITIGSLIKEFRINATTIQDTTEKIHQQVTNVLLEAVNQASIQADI